MQTHASRIPCLPFSVNICCYWLKQNKFSNLFKDKKEIGVTLLAMISHKTCYWLPRKQNPVPKLQLQLLIQTSRFYMGTWHKLLKSKLRYFFNITLSWMKIWRWWCSRSLHNHSSLLSFFCVWSLWKCSHPSVKPFVYCNL